MEKKSDIKRKTGLSKKKPGILKEKNIDPELSMLLEGERSSQNIPLKKAASTKDAKKILKEAYKALDKRDVNKAESLYHELLVLYAHMSVYQQSEIYPAMKTLETAMKEKKFQVSMDHVHRSVSERDLLRAKNNYRKAVER